MAEALAMQHRLSLADQLGHQQVQAELDSLEVKNACSDEERWWSEAAAVFADCVTMVGALEAWNSNTVQEKQMKRLIRLLGFVILVNLIVIGF
jgi:hypothetical protein